MLRCCQICWEDFYWNCFEERFCYDETIAIYNPEEDEDYISSIKSGNDVLGRIQTPTYNNNLRISSIICNQPVQRNNSSILSNAKIHEEDYRREIQTNMPTLGPEILGVFANSQIFQDNQLSKLNRNSTRASLTSDRLLKRFEGNADVKTDKRVIFTITSESSPEGSQIMSDKSSTTDEIMLRPRLIDRHPYLLPAESKKSYKPLRNVKSVPHFNLGPFASDADIFAITGSCNSISMTPEVPSISYTNLPKNYEDTPTIEKYRVFQSLHSIQSANAARVNQEDHSMPRYFRHSRLVSGSSELSSREEIPRPEKEKSKRLQMLRGTLPPLLIHSVSFRKARDEAKQLV